MAVRQDINVGLLAFVGIVGAMLLMISFWGLEGWYAHEVDLLMKERLETDRNLAWTEMRDEQYANIGDSVGNATIYAAAEAGDAALGDSDGYRFASRERDVVVIPIHAAMARIVQQFGGLEVTAAQMREADGKPVALVNRAYDDFMTPALPRPKESHTEPPAAGGERP